MQFKNGICTCAGFAQSDTKVHFPPKLVEMFMSEENVCGMDMALDALVEFLSDANVRIHISDTPLGTALFMSICLLIPSSVIVNPTRHRDISVLITEKSVEKSDLIFSAFSCSDIAHIPGKCIVLSKSNPENFKSVHLYMRHQLPVEILHMVLPQMLIRHCQKKNRRDMAARAIQTWWVNILYNPRTVPGRRHVSRLLAHLYVPNF